ncbi:MAG: hypothetical protein OER88_13800, partial [Planctomycetota bacterium]|nr:hypothetical protein [Planctomycetota bacterium]
IQDGYLYVTPTLDAMRRLLRPRKPETTKRYEEALKDVPATVAVASYDENRSGMGLMLQAMMAGIAQSLNGAAPPTGLLTTPPAIEYGTTISFTVADENGIFSQTRSPTGGFGSFGGVMGIVVLASIAIPNLHQARVAANESAAISTMRGLHVAQETYQAAVSRDGDRDGDGEYGFLVDLLGRARAGETRIAGTRRLVNLEFERRNGDFVRRGYYFRIYLPSDDGSPVGGNERAARLRQVDGDLAETIMVIVAWPVSRGTSGTRAFVMDATGNLYQCGTGAYGDELVPPPDILSSQAGNLASEPIRRGQPTRDGHRWQRAR